MAAPRVNSSAERRRVGRPRNGDVKPCTNCRGLLEFNERYRFEGHVVPAWLCDNATCRSRELVRLAAMRAVAGSRRLPRESSQVQPGAKRTMLKARSPEPNSRKRAARSQARIKDKAS